MKNNKTVVYKNLDNAFTDLEKVRDNLLEEDKDIQNDLTKILQKLDIIKTNLNRKISVDDFHNACVYDRKNVVLKYISQNGDINVKLKTPTFEASALIVSINNSRWEIVRILVKAKADLSFVDEKGDTALIKAIKKFDTPMNIIKLLVTKDNIEKPNKLGETPLCVAAKMEKLDSLKFLLKTGANVNYRNPKNGWTPIMVALREGNFQIARELMKYGAVLEIPKNDDY